MNTIEEQKELLRALFYPHYFAGKSNEISMSR